MSDRLIASETGRSVGRLCHEPAAFAAALAQDPAADRHDQAGLLGQRDELVGADHAALGVVPAQQRLDAADRPVLQADDRLVEELELIGRQRALQVGAQLQALQHALVHLGLEEAVAALAVALGDVHRRVGVADQLVGVGHAVLGGDRDAEAAAQRELLVGGGQRRADGLHDALGGVGRLLDALDVLQQDGELIAAEARGGVAGADRQRQALGHLAKHVVARGVAERVVDDLEVVEVDEDDPDAARLAAAARDRVADALDEQRAVGQAGDRVVERLVGELALEGLALADVARVEDDAADVLVAGQVGEQDLELARGPVLVGQRALQRLRGDRRVDAVGDQAQQAAAFALLHRASRCGGRRRPRASSRARARSRGSGRRWSRRDRAR